MNSKKYAWIAYAMIWLSMSIAVSIAMYITQSAKPLWAMLIPCFINIELSSKEE